MGKNGGGDEEDLLTFLPWAGVRWRGGSTAGGGLFATMAGGGAGSGDGGLGGEEEMVVEVLGATGSRAGPFIGAGRR
jgi:hypothetical protein